MALVAYDNSDSSDYEDEDDENEIKATEVKKVTDIPFKNPIVQNGPSTSQQSEENQSLFNQLPQPSIKKKAVLEEDDEFLHKKESTTDSKPKSRITIPSLSDFKDVDVTVPSSKTRASNGKKSGLLSILPQPRNAISISRPLIPNVVAQKPQTTTVKKKELPPPAKVTKHVTNGLVTEYSDESDNDEVCENDFFSINKPIDLPVEDLPLPVEETVETIKKLPRSIESYFKKDHVELQPDEEHYDDGQSLEISENVAAPSNNEVQIDEEAILKLCGSRGKRKREEIQIVDINQQEVLSEARQMLLKGLMDDTSKRQSASKKRGHEPTSQQRRKHQITYLAHQAKANEAELQNQWANNRMTKRQTQSKYGF
ncbi:unnamed protein product [Euphydryas editha]|uniref:Proline-rich protein PRCC n=1 Tax=Euphydryas editha TaxID=104508 RepID=A0AAU9UWN3_EUPED|nr:unnamed protein product [Euphydryas editha]